MGFTLFVSAVAALMVYCFSVCDKELRSIHRRQRQTKKKAVLGEGKVVFRKKEEK
jgi:hypothetical protein